MVSWAPAPSPWSRASTTSVTSLRRMAGHNCAYPYRLATAHSQPAWRSRVRRRLQGVPPPVVGAWLQAKGGHAQAAAARAATGAEPLRPCA